MPHRKYPMLVNAVLQATLEDIETRGISLARNTGRVFKLVEAGETDFEKLKQAALGDDDVGTSR